MQNFYNGGSLKTAPYNANDITLVHYKVPIYHPLFFLGILSLVSTSKLIKSARLAHTVVL